MANNVDYGKAVKDRFSTIRLRTWTLTLSIIVTLILYFLVQVGTRQAINPIDFFLLSAMQILIHCLYFPDGEIFGQQHKSFVNNKTAYNEKASIINEKHYSEKLREFCLYDYEKRQTEYIEKVCGKIGITTDELNKLRQLTEKEIKKIDKITLSAKNDEEPQILYITKRKRKMLYALLFCDLPVEQNYPDTILSAVESDGSKAIKDISISYKKQSYITKILKAVVLGGIFAYIGYTVRDGIGIAELVSITMYLTTLFSSAVTSYSSGEICSKVYKNQFYVELANFIDKFFEWSNIKNDTQKAISLDGERK